MQELAISPYMDLIIFIINVSLVSHSFLVFYRLDDLGVMNLRVQRVRPFKSQIQPMSVEKWTGILYDLQAKHKEVCRYEKD